MTASDDADESGEVDADESGVAPNDRYLATLAEQADLRRRGAEALEGADPTVDSVREALVEEADRFDGDLVVLAASDFGYPGAFVPEGMVDPSAALNRLLDELHRESGKWREDEALRPVRAAVRDAEPTAHKVLPALLDGDVRYDLPAGVDDAANFVTIRQAVGLVDWLANSYQAEQLTFRY